MYHFTTSAFAKFVPAILLCTAACALTVRAGENVEELKKQRTALDEKLKDLNAKFDAARNALFKNPDFAPLSKKVDDALKARDAKAAADPKVIDARKIAADATAAAKKISDDELAASPDAAALVTQFAAADVAIDDLKSQERIAQFIFGEALRKAAKDPDLKKLDLAAQDAAKAAAGKPNDSAERQAAIAARKALDDAARAKAATLPMGAEQLKKMEELKAKQAAAAESRKTLDAKFIDVKKTVLSKSEKLAAARKTENAASAEANKIAGEQTKAEKDVLSAARKELDDARQAKLTADPAATALRLSIDETQKQIKELANKIRDTK